MTKFRTIIAFAAAVVTAGVLAGCRAEEQGRPLVLNKGDYSGPQDPALSEMQLNELKDRVALQGGSAAGAAGSATLERPTEEKSAPTSKELNERLRQQAGPPDVAKKPGAQSQTGAAQATPQSPAPAAQTPNKPANN